MTATIFTIGHSRHDGDRFLAYLQKHKIDTLVDVRRVPWSRMNPQFNRDRLEASLNSAGLAYVHLEDLGGLRDEGIGNLSSHTGWRNRFLRRYAYYASTLEFRTALEVLMVKARESTCGIMCAEGDWRKCHRQIVSDYLMGRHFNVLHIRPDGGVEPAALTPFATREEDGTIRYSGKPKSQLSLDIG